MSEDAGLVVMMVVVVMFRLERSWEGRYAGERDGFHVGWLAFTTANEKRAMQGMWVVDGGWECGAARL